MIANGSMNIRLSLLIHFLVLWAAAEARDVVRVSVGRSPLVSSATGCGVDLRVWKHPSSVNFDSMRT